MQLRYNDTLKLEEAVGSVALQRSPAQSELDQSGMTLLLPSAPLLAIASPRASAPAW